jgi:hypothetical protein
MAEAFVNVTEGSGKKLWGFDWTVGANTVISEAVHLAPFPYPTYSIVAGLVSAATANDHLICLNAGASLKVRVHRIRLEQHNNATTASISQFQVLRTTTAAPTGGTAITPAPFDTGSAAAGATGRSLPTAKGTESTELTRTSLILRQAIATAQSQPEELWEWTQSLNGMPIIIPAGTTNGLVIKNVNANAAATMTAYIEFSESAF